jgi:hypothetical protein
MLINRKVTALGIVFFERVVRVWNGSESCPVASFGFRRAEPTVNATG